MITNIEIFVFVLSSLFTIRYTLEFITNIRREDPVPMKISVVNQFLLYAAISYLLTFAIIGIFLK